MIEWLTKKGGWRNPNHTIWFISSILFLIFTLLILGKKVGTIALLIPIFVHTAVAINALQTSYIKKVPSEIYSKDCFWYNTILVVVYLFLMYKL